MNFITKVICPASSVSKMTSRFDVTHVLSLMDPDARVFLHPERKVAWKKFVFEDCLQRFDYNAPKIEDMEKILDWGKSISDDSNLLVHCYAGVSRSTACAIAIECARNDVKTSEEINEVYDYIKSIRPLMMPNRLLIEYADYNLKLGGLLVEKNITYLRELKEKDKKIPFKLIYGK